MPIVKVNREVLAARIRKRLKQMQVTALTIPDTGPGDCWADCCNCCSSSGGGGGGGDCGSCTYAWDDGLGNWQLTSDDCTGVCACTYPNEVGRVGAVAVTTCATSFLLVEKKIVETGEVKKMKGLYLSLTNYPIKTVPLIWSGAFWQSVDDGTCFFRLYKENGLETWVLEENRLGSVTKTKGVPANTEPFFMMGNLISAACNNSKFLITE